MQDGYHPLIAQPFGVPSPSLTAVDAPFTFRGTGLYPNSKLKAKSSFTLDTVEATTPVPGVIEGLSPTAASDGSFSLIVVPENPSVLDEAGTKVSATVIDAYGNWAACQCATAGWPKGGSSPSGTSTVVH